MVYEHKENQKELFDEFKTEEKGFKLFKNKGRLSQNRIFLFQLSIEKLFFLLIALVLVIVVTFCFGVERGKCIASGPRPIVAAAVQSKPAERQVINTIQVKVKPAMVTNVATKNSLAKGKPGEIYTIRIAAYVNKKSAADLSAKIRQSGFPAYIRTSGNFYIICVGDYTDKKQADRALLELKKIYKDCYIKTGKK